MIEKSQGNVGVIVGRFQIHELHEAHKELIQSVRDRHERIIIVLGVSPLRNTMNNPLDFRARKAMLEDVSQYLEVLYIMDTKSDEVWSQQLDALLAAHLSPHDAPVLYGSRDSFIKYYLGRHKTCVLEAKNPVSATEIRRSLHTTYPPTKNFRAGVIHATAQRFPVCYQTVDVAVVDERDGKKELLLVRKKDETEWYLPGGFSDISSPNLEADARREVAEEANVEITDPVYVGSTLIDDWRYRKEVDKIKTVLFEAKYLSGHARAGDDVTEVRGFEVEARYDPISKRAYLASAANVVQEHKKLLDMLATKWLAETAKP